MGVVQEYSRALQALPAESVTQYLHQMGEEVLQPRSALLTHIAD